MTDQRYTEGTCADGAGILKDGEMLTIEQVLEDLNKTPTREQEVDEFNEGFYAASAGVSIDDEPCRIKHDMWRVGYSWWWWSEGGADKFPTLEADLSRERNRANALGTGLTKENVRLASLLEKVEAENAVLMVAAKESAAMVETLRGSLNGVCDDNAALRAKLGRVKKCYTDAMYKYDDLFDYGLQDIMHQIEAPLAVVEGYCPAEDLPKDPWIYDCEDDECLGVFKLAELDNYGRHPLAPVTVIIMPKEASE